MGPRPSIPALLRDPRRTSLRLAPDPGPVALMADGVSARSPQHPGELASGWTPDVRGRASLAPAGVSILGFGRYAGWSLRQLATQDRNYLEWLLRSSGGRQYHAEIEALLHSS